jgi:hypothetical protein
LASRERERWSAVRAELHAPERRLRVDRPGRDAGLALIVEDEAMVLMMLEDALA